MLLPRKELYCIGEGFVNGNVSGEASADGKFLFAGCIDPNCTRALDRYFEFVYNIIILEEHGRRRLDGCSYAPAKGEGGNTEGFYEEKGKV